MKLKRVLAFISVSLSLTACDFLPEFSIKVDPSTSSSSKTFSQTIPFDAGTDTSYTFTASKLNLTGGSCKLSFVDQTDDDGNASLGFGAATTAGAAWNAGTSNVKLLSTAACDGTTTNCAELDSTWAPK